MRLAGHVSEQADLRRKIAERWGRNDKRAYLASFDAIADYMKALIREKRRKPTDDMLSGLANHADPATPKMSDYDLISTAILLLVAGHETTVNLITNGLLTLLRHPDELERLRQDPGRAPRLIEELMRYEPPVQFRTRRALSAIDIAGVTIPAWCTSRNGTTCTPSSRSSSTVTIILSNGMARHSARSSTVFPAPSGPGGEK